jgi:uncharacterized protein YjbI with pentapeptide repeats
MRWPAWLGVGEHRWKKSPNEEVQPAKTAWDFLQLLIVPAILVAIALAFNASQASRERSREDRRIREDRALAAAAREDAILDAYFAKMSGLILDRDLTSAKEGTAVRQVARTATLTTLRRLDGSRKGEVVRFLYEARLLYQRRQRVTGVWGPPVINLEGADLRGVDLSEASLEVSVFTDPTRRVLLSGDLRGAKFDHASLARVEFGGGYGIKLRGASFNGADTDDVSFFLEDVRGVSFKEALLYNVDFTSSDLRGTVFDDATIVRGTSFVGTCLTNATFAGATFNRFLGKARGTTTFRGAKGHDVDFSDAVNLSSVRLSPGVTEVRFEGAKERPKMIARPLDRSEEQICN